MTQPPKVFERKNEQHGVTRTERDRLVDEVDDYLIAMAMDGRAKRITITVELELKGERE